MKNALIWFTVFLLLLLVAGITPKSAQEWLIVETGAVMFWMVVGLFLFARLMWRLFNTPIGPH